MEIRIACDVKDFAKIEDLIIIQGDLKEFTEESYQKLRKEIIDLGFSFPFFVWDDNGILKLLDGSHRKKTILRMKEEGISFPEMLPIVKIFAKDYSEAKRKLLAVTSNYAKITEEGLRNFVLDIDDFSLEEMKDSFSFSDINLNYFDLTLEELNQESNVEYKDFPKNPDENQIYQNKLIIYEIKFEINNYSQEITELINKIDKLGASVKRK